MNKVTFKIRLTARKSGSIGKLDTETRIYAVEAYTQEQAEDLARGKAYDEGLEHTHIVSVYP